MYVYGVLGTCVPIGYTVKQLVSGFMVALEFEKTRPSYFSQGWAQEGEYPQSLPSSLCLHLVSQIPS